jgi:hypothetical protein
MESGPGGAIPMPIVTLNRCTLVGGIVLGLVLRQPLFTTLLFLLLLPAVMLGPRGSLIFQIGKRLLARQIAAARAAGRVEDRRLMRFNNSIALILLGVAQVAFLAGLTVGGWVLAAAVAAAASVALAGFCLGCYLYVQFKVNRWRLARLLD